MVSQVGIVTLRVDNWKAQLEFYRDKVGLKPRMMDEAHEYAMFDTGAVRFALEGPNFPAFAKAKGHSPLMVNFTTEDIHAAMQDLKFKGVKVLTDIKKGPGYDFIAFADPEGNEHIVFQRAPRPPS